MYRIIGCWLITFYRIYNSDGSDQLFLLILSSLFRKMSHFSWEAFKRKQIIWLLIFLSNQAICCQLPLSTHLDLKQSVKTHLAVKYGSSNKSDGIPSPHQKSMLLARRLKKTLSGYMQTQKKKCKNMCVIFESRLV